MRKLFKAIKQNDFEEVQRIIEKKPELANCISKAPPKMDDGQSALQVAIKNGGGWSDTRIISYLLDKGADVNFMEDDKGLGPWDIACLPVLADMVRAIYMNATELSYKYHPEETKNKVEEFIAVFERMLELGADPNKQNNRLHPIWTEIIFDGYLRRYARDNDDYNTFVDDLTKRLLDLIICHGANIYRFYSSFPKDDSRYTKLYPYTLQMQILINNLVFNRELSYGIPEEDQSKTEGRWIDMMKLYYEKDNPYYGAVVSEERKQFFQKLEQMKDEEEKDL